MDYVWNNNDWVILKKFFHKINYLITDIVAIKLNNFSIYPNPCTSILNIDTDNSTTPQVRIYTLTGSLVKSENFNKVDVSELKQGMYFVSINGSKMQKVIIQ